MWIAVVNGRGVDIDWDVFERRYAGWSEELGAVRPLFVDMSCRYTTARAA